MVEKGIRNKLLPWLFLTCIALVPLCDAQVRLYVSPNGNDAWSGTQASGSGSDGPKATLEGARDELRRLRSRGSLDAGAVVEVAPGSYPQLTTLTLTRADCGTPSGPIIFRSSSLHGAVIEGGVAVNNWKNLDPSLVSRVDPSIASNLRCADLRTLGVSDFGSLPKATWSGNNPSTAIEFFVDAHRQRLSRWPAKDYAQVTEGIDKLNFKADFGSSRMKTGEPDVWVAGYPSGFDWAFVQMPASIDKEAGTVTLLKDPFYVNKKGARFFIKNSLGDLNQPGEYYVDKASGLLVYYPLGDLGGTQNYVSVNPGPVAKFIDVTDVTFEGFTFEHGRNDGIVLQRCSNVVLRGNEIRECGGCGVVVQELGPAGSSSHDNLIQSNRVSEIGESGITVTAGNRLTLEPANNVVENNVITDIGEDIPAVRPGVLLSGVSNRALHNDIHNCPSLGIQIFGNNNVAEGNHIWDACTDTVDSGAIYLSGTDASQRGNIVRDNFTEDTYARVPGNDGIWGIYLDGRASGVTVTGNVVKNSNRGMILNGGRDNLIENNVMVDCKIGFQIDEASHSEWKTLESSLKSVDWQHGEYARQYPTLVNILDDDPLSPKGNLINRNVTLRSEKPSLVRSIYGVHLSSNANRGKLEIGWTNNVFGDSGLFVDELHGDFTPLPGTDLEKAGFKPVRTSNAGVKSDAFIKPAK